MASLISDKTLRIYNTQDFSRTSSSTVVWSTDTGEIEAVLEHPGRNPVRVCAFSPRLFTPGFGVFLNEYLSTVNDTTVVACSFNPCGQMFVTESTYGDLRLLDLDMNQLHAEKNNHDLGVTCYCFGPKILSGGGGGGDDIFLPLSLSLACSQICCKVQLLHILTGRSAPVLSFPRSLLKKKMYLSVLPPMILCCRYVTPCAFAPSAPLIATVSMDKTVNIWRVEDGRSGHDVWSVIAQRRACEEGLETLVENFKANNIDGAELREMAIGRWRTSQ
uniref:Uncharacterized protein n=1 Tax=Oncorhynchus tshawytscha TaxID=74940 RepID=A0A8C8F774_ONCTS